MKFTLYKSYLTLKSRTRVLSYWKEKIETYEHTYRGRNHPTNAFNREIIKHWICLVRWGLKKLNLRAYSYRLAIMMLYNVLVIKYHLKDFILQVYELFNLFLTISTFHLFMKWLSGKKDWTWISPTHRTLTFSLACTRLFYCLQQRNNSSLGILW